MYVYIYSYMCVYTKLQAQCESLRKKVHVLTESETALKSQLFETQQALLKLKQEGMCICVFEKEYVCACACIYSVCAHMYIYVYVYISIYICIYMYIYIYIHTYIPYT